MGRFDSEQRVKILDAAIRVFARHGLAGAAIRLVGREAGVNSALIYYYFENKEVLFADAIRQVVRDYLDLLHERVSSTSEPAICMDVLVEALVDYYEAYPERMRLMSVGIALYPELLGKAVGELVQERPLLPLVMIQEGMRRGELKSLHPAVAWWSILGACIFQLNMREVMSHVQPSPLPVPPPDLATTRTHVKQIFRRGLMSETSQPGAEQPALARAAKSTHKTRKSS